jgi:hypothetical protein
LHFDDDVLFIGTRFSNLYTAVHTPPLKLPLLLSLPPPFLASTPSTYPSASASLPPPPLIPLLLPHFPLLPSGPSSYTSYASPPPSPNVY